MCQPQWAYEDTIKGSTVPFLSQRFLSRIHIDMEKRTMSLLQLLLLVYGVCVPASAQVCRLLSQPVLPLLSAQKDINIGAVLSFHRSALLKMHTFTSKPEPTTCGRSVWKQLFGIDTINSLKITKYIILIILQEWKTHNWCSISTASTCVGSSLLRHWFLLLRR